MKRNYLISAVVFSSVLLFQLGCQEQAAQIEKPTTASETRVAGSPEKAESALASLDKAAPKITFENVVHDFGQIGTGANKRVAEFKFTNTGDALLEIMGIEKCCGVKTILDKTEFSPGESSVVKAEFQAFQKSGPFMRNIYVNSNDKTKPRVALSIKAVVVSKVSYSPKRLKLFLDEENAGCPKIVLSSLDNQPFAITQFRSTADCITADVDGSVEATKFILDPRVDMEKLNNNLKGRVNVSLTHPEEKEADILFDVIPKYVISPPMILTFSAEPQNPILRKVTLLNNYGGDFEIESVSSKNNTVKVLSREKIRNGYQFNVEIMPPPPEGKTQFMDAFVVKIKDGNELGVVCRGFYKRK